MGRAPFQFPFFSVWGINFTGESLCCGNEARLGHNIVSAKVWIHSSCQKKHTADSRSAIMSTESYNKIKTKDSHTVEWCLLSLSVFDIQHLDSICSSSYRQNNYLFFSHIFLLKSLFFHQSERAERDQIKNQLFFTIHSSSTIIHHQY